MCAGQQDAGMNNSQDTKPVISCSKGSNLKAVSTFDQPGNGLSIVIVHVSAEEQPWSSACCHQPHLLGNNLSDLRDHDL